MASENKRTIKRNQSASLSDSKNVAAHSEHISGRMIVGAVDINVFLAFVFGVIFLGIMLVFATNYPNPTSFQIQVFMVALSISGAGIGGLLPGHLDVRYKNVLRAGGAFAIFIIIWFFQPAIIQSVTTFEEPNQLPEPIIDNFFSNLDNGDTFQSYSALDPVFTKINGLTVAKWKELYNINIRDLGKMEKRKNMGIRSFTSTSGELPIGLYREFSYLTKYVNAKGCRQEAITVRATQDKQWTIAGYLISPSSVECPLSFASESHKAG